MTELAEEIRAGVHEAGGALAVWVERDYAAPLEVVADGLPDAWAPDGRHLTLEAVGTGCVVRADVRAQDVGEAAALIDAWAARLDALAAEVPGQLRLAA